MSNPDDSCLAICCGACCLTIFSALNQWCNMSTTNDIINMAYYYNLTNRDTDAFGSKGCCPCGGPRGCCGSCFDGRFNEDSWEEDGAKQESAKQAGNTQDGHQASEAVSSQPEGVPAMETSGTATAP